MCKAIPLAWLLWLHFKVAPFIILLTLLCVMHHLRQKGYSTASAFKKHTISREHSYQTSNAKCCGSARSAGGSEKNYREDGVEEHSRRVIKA